MALKQSISFRGLSITDAYIKIDHVFATTNGIRILVQVYASDTERLAGGEPLYSSCVDVDFADVMSGSNPIQMCYNAMKALPKFTDAVDC